jgi:hypothetical protein
MTLSMIPIPFGSILGGLKSGTLTVGYGGSLVIGLYHVDTPTVTNTIRARDNINHKYQRGIKNSPTTAVLHHCPQAPSTV